MYDDDYDDDYYNTAPADLDAMIAYEVHQENMETSRWYRLRFGVRILPYQALAWLKYQKWRLYARMGWLKQYDEVPF